MNNQDMLTNNKIIAIHSDSFSCGAVFACMLLIKHTNEFYNAKIIRNSDLV